MMTTPQDDNPYASPQSEETAVFAPVELSPIEAWGDGDMVVIAGDGTLPRRCMKCGAAVADGRSPIRRQLRQFAPPRVQLTVFAIAMLVGVSGIAASGLISSAIQSVQARTTPKFATTLTVVLGAMLLCVLLYLFWLLDGLSRSRAKRISIAVFRCDRHRRQLSKLHGLSYFILACSLAIGSVYWSSPEMILFRVLPATLGLIYVSTISYASLAGKLFFVRQVNGHNWLRGFGKPFVDSLPPYPHTAERS